MDDVAAKDDLKRYLQRGREALLFKLEGLSDYDVRRPLVPTGTNLLGLVKHCGYVEYGYFRWSFGRSHPDLPAWADDAEPNLDMYAAADESREQIERYYRAACEAADETIDELDLDAEAEVPWWPPDRRRTTLHRLLVHVATETHRHAGHADILREQIDGAAGISAEFTNLAEGGPGYWSSYVDQLEQIAARFK